MAGLHWNNEPFNSRQIRVIAVLSLMIILSTIAVFLRFLSRRLSHAKIWYDDYAAIAALFFSYGPNIAVLTAVHYGLGQRESVTGFRDAQIVLILGYVEQLTWQMAMPLIKISLLLFYFRIFPNRSMRLATYIVGAVVVGLLISTTVVAIVSCLPVQYYWDRTIPGGHCLNYNLFYIIGAAFNSTTDLVVLCLPLPIIWRLQVDIEKKIGLSFIFLLGGFVFVASIIRMAILKTLDPLDITWTGVYVGIWACAEASMGVIGACIPALAPLALKAMGLQKQAVQSWKYTISKDRYQRRRYHDPGFTSIATAVGTDDDCELMVRGTDTRVCFDADGSGKAQMMPFANGIKITEEMEQVTGFAEDMEKGPTSKRPQSKGGGDGCE